jgi:hypothetical protein
MYGHARLFRSVPHVGGSLVDDLGLNCTRRDSGNAFGADLTKFPTATTTHTDYMPGQPTDSRESPCACPAARPTPSTDDPVMGG